MARLRISITAFATAVVLIGVVARPSAAQSNGLNLWLSGGVGAAQVGPANTAAHDRHAGLSATFGGGAVVSDRLLAGLQASLWSHDDGQGTSRADFFTVALQGYPLPFGPLANVYLLAGAGVGSSSFSTQTVTVDSSRLNATRFAVQFGLGYDIPVFCPFWLTTFVQSLNTIGGGANPHIRPGEGTDNAVMLHAGFALTYYRSRSAQHCSGRSSDVRNVP